jgi:hypothetical protein
MKRVSLPAVQFEEEPDVVIVLAPVEVTVPQKPAQLFAEPEPTLGVFGTGVHVVTPPPEAAIG